MYPVDSVTTSFCIGTPYFALSVRGFPCHPSKVSARARAITNNTTRSYSEPRCCKPEDSAVACLWSWRHVCSPASALRNILEKCPFIWSAREFRRADVSSANHLNEEQITNEGAMPRTMSDPTGYDSLLNLSERPLYLSTGGERGFLASKTQQLPLSPSTVHGPKIAGQGLSQCD